MFAGENCKSEMCPDPILLTLQGESVVECAEFLITTLLTFPLFGTQIFLKGYTLSSYFTLNAIVGLMRKCVCNCFNVALSTGCLLLFCVQLQHNHMLYHSWLICATPHFLCPPLYCPHCFDLLHIFLNKVFKSWSTQFKCENLMSFCVHLQPI